MLGKMMEKERDERFCYDQLGSHRGFIGSARVLLGDS